MGETAESEVLIAVVALRGTQQIAHYMNGKKLCVLLDCF